MAFAQLFLIKNNTNLMSSNFLLNYIILLDDTRHTTTMTKRRENTNERKENSCLSHDILLLEYSSRYIEQRQRILYIFN